MQLIGLPSPAGGPAERVWFTGREPGSAPRALYVRFADGRTYVTPDFEQWKKTDAEAPASDVVAPADARYPEPPARLYPARRGGARLYAGGTQAWRSDDGGMNWRNLTGLGGNSILGGPINDLAVDPEDQDRIVAATGTGIWMSIDGGLSWQGLNENLPNLAVRRILSAPSGSRILRISAAAGNGSNRELDWLPGQRLGWIESRESSLAREEALRNVLSAQLEVPITAVAAAGETIYAGAAGGRIWASLDAGRNWRSFETPGGTVERFWADPADSRFALAALASTEPSAPRVLRTMNGGAYWDDISSDLPQGPAYGLTADRASGAVYVATSRGVFYTATDLRAPGPATSWRSISSGLPEGAARDVRLDDSGNVLLAAIDGYGVFSTIAPHRARRPVVVHAADYAPRAAAPGALLSVLGARVQSADANRLQAPVLAAQEAESQIQVPFEASGDSLRLVLESGQGRLVFPLALQAVSPAILVDRDGGPLIVDADTGLQLDAMNPATGGSRIQVLASGLGRVRPDWPSGMPAPLENPPRVLAALRAELAGAPVEITRATLAPGYVGYYLVEIQLPDFVDAGAPELVIEAGGKKSNPVRLFVGQ